MDADKEQREIYEARLKYLRDEDGALETARIRGIEQGKIEVARKLLEKNFSVKEICEITGLSEDEIKKIK